VQVPAATKSLYYDRLVLAFAIRFVAAAAVGADRVFNITYQEIYN